MQARISRTNLLFAGIMIGCAALLALVVLADRGGGLAYTYTFKDAKDLPVGAPVKMNGVQIGEVTRVELTDPLVEVGVRIHPEHRRRILAPPASAARIKKDSIVLGTPFVEVMNKPGATKSERMPSGAVVEGLDSWTEEAVWQGSGHASALALRTMEASREQFDRLETWATEGSGKELADKTRVWLEGFEGTASDKAGEYRVKMLAQLAKGATLLKEMKDDPRTQGAAEDVKGALRNILVQARNLETTASLKANEAVDTGVEAVTEFAESAETQETVAEVEETLQRLLDESKDMEAGTRASLEQLLKDLNQTAGDATAPETDTEPAAQSPD